MQHGATLFASAGLAIALAVPAQASLLVSETFDYDPSQEFLHGQPAGSGLSGTWEVEDGDQPAEDQPGHQVRTLENPLSYGDFDPVGRSVRSADSWQDPRGDRRAATAALNDPISSDDQTVWMGFLYNHHDRFTNSGRHPLVGLHDSADSSRQLAVHIRRLSDDERRGVLGVTLGGAGADGPFVGYEGSLPDPEDQIEGLPEWTLDDDRTFHVLARFDLTAEGAWAFLNIYTDGELPGEEPESWDVWTFLDGGLGDGALDTLLLGGSTQNHRFDIDQVRIGTDMQSVLIPEPANLSLLGLGGLMLLRRRCP